MSALEPLHPSTTGALRPIRPDEDGHGCLISSLPPGAALGTTPLNCPDQMHPLTEYFLWYIPDERTGELRLTKFKLSRADAERAFPGAEPDLSSREVREVPEIAKAPANRRPGEN